MKTKRGFPAVKDRHCLNERKDVMGIERHGRKEGIEQKGRKEGRFGIEKKVMKKGDLNERKEMSERQ
jgi:hypothetical protein